jgi:hypothetical protein
MGLEPTTFCMASSRSSGAKRYAAVLEQSNSPPCLQNRLQNWRLTVDPLTKKAPLPGPF